jgi:hypothetical protein
MKLPCTLLLSRGAHKYLCVQSKSHLKKIHLPLLWQQHQITRQLTTTSIPTRPNIQDILEKSNSYMPQQQQAIEVSQQLFDLFVPHLEKRSIENVSPFFTAKTSSISQKLTHWETLSKGTSTNDGASQTTQPVPTLNSRGVHIWSKERDKHGESVALAFSTCCAYYLPPDKVHRKYNSVDGFSF